MNEARSNPTGVVIRLSDSLLQQHIRWALGHDHALFFSQTWEDCATALQRERASCVVISMSEQLANQLHAAIRALRSTVGDVRIIGYGPADQTTASSLILLARAGLDDLVFSSEGDALALRAAVRSAEPLVDTHIQDLLDRVVHELPHALHGLLRRCIPRVTARTTIVELASWLGWHRNTLTTRLARAGGPTPERFRAWCLLLHAGHVLDTTTLTIEAVALRLEFASASALSHLVARYVGCSASQLRARGAVSLVLARLAADLATPVPELPPGTVQRPASMLV